MSTTVPIVKDSSSQCKKYYFFPFSNARFFCKIVCFDSWGNSSEKLLLFLLHFIHFFLLQVFLFFSFSPAPLTASRRAEGVGDSVPFLLFFASIVFVNPLVVACPFSRHFSVVLVHPVEPPESAAAVLQVLLVAHFAVLQMTKDIPKLKTRTDYVRRPAAGIYRRFSRIDWVWKDCQRSPQKSTKF